MTKYMYKNVPVIIVLYKRRKRNHKNDVELNYIHKITDEALDFNEISPWNIYNIKKI